ncbi:MAG TPA: DNA-processing protein DprA [Thermoanaerobaculia bacterium]|nr:DNA-processing protein DprA [Thermoanaerobaculia bacterium]
MDERRVHPEPEPSTAAGRPPDRDLPALLIALAAAPEIPYAAACRLAAAAAGDWTPWMVEPARRDGDARDLLAAELGVAPGCLAAACRVAVERADRAAAEREGARREGARVITRACPEYPAKLLDLELPPPALWLRGAIPSGPAIAVVGPRNADRWALEAARAFAHDLAAHGLVVVSGFARGVDAAAHRAALEAPGGRTVAVLGCGLGVPYPRQHLDLADPIADAGGVVSEFPCGTPPAAWRFPVRNRVIAALALGALVVQASRRSGSLITARLALELGREVYAVPGRPGDRRSEGSNLLLRDGAHVALDAGSVLDTLPLAARAALEAAASPAPPDGDAAAPKGALAKQVLAALDASGTGVEELARRLEVGVDALLATLLELELDGLVRRLSRREFARVRGRR